MCLFSILNIFLRNISKLQRPYIIRFITFNLLTLPSANPLLYSYIIAFLTATISLFIPFIKELIYLLFKSYACFIHSSSSPTFLFLRIFLNEFTISIISLYIGYLLFTIFKQSTDNFFILLIGLYNNFNNWLKSNYCYSFI